MGTDIEKLVDLMIQDGMQSLFAKWGGGRTGTKIEDCLRLENEYEKAISALSEEQKDAVRHYCDSISILVQKASASLPAGPQRWHPSLEVYEKAEKTVS